LKEKPELKKTWLTRNDDSETRTNARNKITWANAKTAVATLQSRDELLAAFEQLYSRCLDFGGHPNDEAVFSNMRVKAFEDGGLSFDIVYLSADPAVVGLTLKTTVQVGFAALRVFQAIMPTRFTFLLLDERLDTLGSSGV
jgi:hypothetical protein